MGGCNSLLNKVGVGVGTGLSISGAFTLEGVTGVGINSNTLAGDTLTSVAKSGCDDTTREGLIRVTNAIMSTAILQTTTSCINNANSSQVVNLSCDPVLTNGEDVFESNAACTACMTSVFEGMYSHHDIQRNTWKKDPVPSSVEVTTSIDNEYKALQERLKMCGVSQCKACALSNVSQYNVINQTSGCYANISNTSAVENNLSVLIKQQLLSNQDVLSGVASTFSNPNVTSLTQDLTSRMMTVTSQSFLDEVAAKLQTSQVIQVSSSSSVTANNLTQFSAFTIISEEVNNADIATKAIGEANFDLIAASVLENSSLDSLGQVLFKATTTFASTFDSILGKVLLAVMIGLVSMIAFILGYIIWKAASKVKQVVVKRNVKR